MCRDSRVFATLLGKKIKIENNLPHLNNHIRQHEHIESKNLRSMSYLIPGEIHFPMEIRMAGFGGLPRSANMFPYGSELLNLILFSQVNDP